MTMPNPLSVISWNVNGIRAIIKKEFAESVGSMNPDILCLQETKAAVDEVVECLEQFAGQYTIYANDSKRRKGYSGTAILTRVEPLGVEYDMDMEEHDQEGRVMTMELPGFYLVNVYTPNSGSGMKRLDYRQQWDRDFRDYILSLTGKPVLVCGDLNVAHQPIDLARPKQNYNKSSGYTQEEIDGFSNMLSAGFTDVWRDRYPEEVKYTYWNYMFNARSRNVGWRIDYFLANPPMNSLIEEVRIHNEYLGSDHCPVEVLVRLP